MNGPLDLLPLSREEQERLDPGTLAELLLAAQLRLATTKRLDRRQWDFLVERWNDLSPQERQDRAARCWTKHDWVLLPLDDAAFVCRRCLAYRVGE